MISVIVPIYNVADYLSKCIDSIINQTYRDLEIILVDDGSTDDCPKICDAYKEKDNRIIVIHKENGGLSDARNAGIEIAKGEYISFIDSDDYIDESMYETMLSNLEATDADLCICGFDRVNDNGEVRSTFSYKDSELTRNDAFEMLVQGNVYFIISCNKVYKRKIFDDLGFKKGKTHEDEYIMHHVYGECEKIVTISQPFYYYLVRESSITGTVKGNIKHFDYAESYIDRMEYFSSIKEQDFAARMLPITINLFLRLKKNIGITDNQAKKRCNEIRNSIKANSKSINLSNLSVANRIGVKAFCKSESLYNIWNLLINMLRKIKG